MVLLRSKGVTQRLRLGHAWRRWARARLSSKRARRNAAAPPGVAARSWLAAISTAAAIARIPRVGPTSPRAREYPDLHDIRKQGYGRHEWVYGSTDASRSARASGSACRRPPQAPSSQSVAPRAAANREELAEGQSAVIAAGSEPLRHVSSRTTRLATTIGGETKPDHFALQVEKAALVPWRLTGLADRCHAPKPFGVIAALGWAALIRNETDVPARCPAGPQPFRVAASREPASACDGGR